MQSQRKPSGSAHSVSHAAQPAQPQQSAPPQQQPHQPASQQQPPQKQPTPQRPQPQVGEAAQREQVLHVRLNRHLRRRAAAVGERAGAAVGWHHAARRAVRTGRAEVAVGTLSVVVGVIVDVVNSPIPRGWAGWETSRTAPRQALAPHPPHLQTGRDGRPACPPSSANPGPPEMRRRSVPRTLIWAARKKNGKGEGSGDAEKPRAGQALIPDD